MLLVFTVVVVVIVEEKLKVIKEIQNKNTIEENARNTKCTTIVLHYKVSLWVLPMNFGECFVNR